MTKPQPAIDSRIANLAQAGKIRVALYVPQYSKDPVSGELRGWTIDLVRALGSHLGLDGVPVEHPSPPAAMASLKAGTCDAAIIGIESSRKAELDYSPALVEADYTLLVPAASTFGSLADVDRPGIRVAAVDGHASTMTLRRLLKRATLRFADSLDEAFELLCGGGVEAFASLREVLLRYCAQMPGSRVLPERYGYNSLGMAVPKGQAARLAAISEFVEAAKSSGLVQEAIDRSGWRGIQVAPLEARTQP